MQRRQWSPPPSVPRSGDGRCDGDVRPLRKPSPAREAKGAPGAAGKDASESEAPDIPPPPGGLAACKLEPLRQEAINLLTLDELVELFAHAHH